MNFAIRFFFVLLFPGALSGTTALSQTASSELPRPILQSNAGPWGDIEYVEFPMDFPEELMSVLDTPSQQALWRIPEATTEGLRAFLAQGGLSDSQVKAALDGATLMVNNESSRVFPSETSLNSLDAETRAALYRLLATIEDNPHQRRPTFLNTDNLSVWFQGSGVPRSIIQSIAALAYPTPQGRGYYFSDIALLMGMLTTQTEERTVLRALRRQNAIIATLKLDRNSQLREISDYWTAEYKNKAVLPLLDSVATSANAGGSIDIAHLLPATPRSQLNRFPDRADGVSGRYPDWFWTCYNFFRFVPKNVYADTPERDRLLIDEFESTLPPHRFGDVILLYAGPKILHGCVYIADDIVFTKNSPDIFTPWMLMKLEDVVAFHDVFGSVTLSTLRKEPPAQSSVR